jgi:hypothetical protein
MDLLSYHDFNYARKEHPVAFWVLMPIWVLILLCAVPIAILKTAACIVEDICQ